MANSGSVQWQTLVIGGNTSSVAIDGFFYATRWIWLNNYGKYGLTYVVATVRNCSSPVSGASSPQNITFGINMSEENKTRVKDTVNASILQNGPSIHDQAFFIQNQLSYSYGKLYP